MEALESVVIFAARLRILPRALIPRMGARRLERWRREREAQEERSAVRRMLRQVERDLATLFVLEHPPSLN